MLPTVKNGWWILPNLSQPNHKRHPVQDVNVQPDIGRAGHVRVEVDVVGVEVVLHDVLVDPVDLRPPDPVLAQPQQPVDVRVAAHRPVVGVVLDVETCNKVKT